MKRHSEGDTRIRGESTREQRESQRTSGTFDGRSSPVERLHGAVGNQALESAVSSEEDEIAPETARPRAPPRSARRRESGTTVQRSTSTGTGPEEPTRREPAVTAGMCTRCVRRFRAGKPLGCEECEQALGGDAGESGERRADGGTVIQPSLAVGERTDRSEREAERVASSILRMPDPNSNEQGTDVSERGGVTGGLTVSGELERDIRSLRGGGRPLSDETRSFFEPRFDTDLGNVRIHTGQRADELARSINAEAFTTGEDVVFRRGNYRPESPQGKQLLAHELTHVVQQTGGRAAAKRRTIHRTVSEDNISCANYPRDYPIFDVIETDQPVETIRNAEENAIRLLERSIETINAAIHQVRAQEGDPTVPGTIPEFMADAVSHNFELDPENREVWTGGGMQTVPVIGDRLEAAKERLEADSVDYICLSSTCDADDYAKTWKRGGTIHNTIYLCKRWWTDLSEGEKASTVAHEVLHIYYWSFMKDEGVFGDAESYEQFIEDVWARRTRP